MSLIVSIMTDSNITDWDAVEEYFECITECDIHDSECHEVCLMDLKEADE